MSTITSSFHRDYGTCYRCGKRLIDIIPALLALTRAEKTEYKNLCKDCYIAVFDSIKPLEGKEATS